MGSSNPHLICSLFYYQLVRVEMPYWSLCGVFEAIHAMALVFNNQIKEDQRPLVFDAATASIHRNGVPLYSTSFTFRVGVRYFWSLQARVSTVVFKWLNWLKQFHFRQRLHIGKRSALALLLLPKSIQVFGLATQRSSKTYTVLLISWVVTNSTETTDWFCQKN